MSTNDKIVAILKEAKMMSEDEAVWSAINEAIEKIRNIEK